MEIKKLIQYFFNYQAKIKIKFFSPFEIWFIPQFNISICITEK